MPVTASQSIQKIFNAYRSKINNPLYVPSQPVEALQAYITAVWFTQSDNKDMASTAKNYIERLASTTDTSFIPSDEILCWETLEICSSYEATTGYYVEYKLNLTTAQSKREIIHRHAQFQQQDTKCVLISQSLPMVRVIGDPVLHQPGIPYPEKPTEQEQVELSRQISIAKAILIKTGGGGIAANQCAQIDKPYQFAIVGIFYESPEHVTGIKRRYPNAKFPQAMIMVNPKILRASKDVQKFNHGCLSVPSPNRCEILSPKEMEISYQDASQDMTKVTVCLKEDDAVALWHELNHILDGQTYLDTALSYLSPQDVKTLEEILVTEIQSRSNEAHIAQLTVPPFKLTMQIDTHGFGHLNTDKLKDALGKMTTDTLTGIQERCTIFHKKKTSSETVVVIGGNRGLGLGFVEKYLAAGYSVYATHRQSSDINKLTRLKEQFPDKLQLIILDVTNKQQVTELPNKINALINILIINAGIIHSFPDSPELIVDENIQDLMQVNTYAPDNIIRALFAKLFHANSITVYISSTLSCTAHNLKGRYHGYRASKAAANIILQDWNIELASLWLNKQLPLNQRPCAFPISPGWVQTDMGGQRADITVDQSVSQMLIVIDKIRVKKDCSLYLYDGSILEKYPTPQVVNDAELKQTQAASVSGNSMFPKAKAATTATPESNPTQQL